MTQKCKNQKWLQTSHFLWFQQQTNFVASWQIHDVIISKCTKSKITELDLLSIVIISNEFITILWGWCKKAFIDHENIQSNMMNSVTDHVLRWQQFLEEYSHELIYHRMQNIVADVIRFLDNNPLEVLKMGMTLNNGTSIHSINHML